MVSSINSTASESIQQMIAQMFQNMAAADTDGTKGLSKEELSSIDTSSEVGGSAFLKSLTDQFDQLDADGNGQLSGIEMASAKPPEGPMGPPPGLDIETNDDFEAIDATGSVEKTNKAVETASSEGAGTENATDTLMKKIMETFLDSFADGYSQSGSEDSLKSADTDGTAGLSKDELASIDTGKNTGKAKMVNELIENFGKIDADGDGQLAKSEIIASKSSEIAGNSSSAVNLASNLGNSLGSLSSSFVQKLLNSYQGGNMSGGLSSIASSLNIAV